MGAAKAGGLRRSLPSSSGVYLMKDARGRILYVGKAKDLRARVSHYFQGVPEDPRIRRMVARVRSVETIRTPSEIEALFLEARLIKELQPRYNDRLKDDKSFAVLALTRHDDFPKVWIVRETDDVPAERFGPFPSAFELRRAVRVLQKIFRFATCRLEIREGDAKRRYARPCLLHALGRCTAPCAARISRQRYAEDIESFRRYLLGGRKELAEALRAEMKAAAGRLDFERAAELRDRARAVESLAGGMERDFGEGDLSPRDPAEGGADLARVLGLEGPVRVIEGVDVAHLSGSGSVGSLVTFVDGIPFKSGYRRYKIRTVAGIDDPAMIREVVRRRYRRLKDEGASMPDVLLVDGGPGQLESARAALAEVGAGPREVLSLAKGEEILYRGGRPLPLRKDSPALRLLMAVRDEAHRFAQRYHRILRRRRVME